LVPTSPGVLADDTPLVPADPDMARVVDAWPRLSKAIKAGILALVQAAGGPDV